MSDLYTLGEGEAYGEMAAFAGFGDDLELAAELADALFDADQSEAAVARGGGVEAAAIVADGQFQLGGRIFELHLRLLGAGVAGAVGECFLHDTVGAHFVLLGQVLKFAFGLDGDGYAAPFREVAGLPLEGGEEAAIEDGGAEADGEIADGAEGLFGDGFGFGEVMGEVGRVFAELFQGGEFHAEAGEHLADFVVEFSGERFALLLLGVHELGGEVAELFFGLFGFDALAIGAGFEGGDADDAADGDEDADGEGDADDAFNIGAEGDLAEVHLLVLLAVGGGGESVDFIGDGEDGLAAGALLFAEEICGALAAFVGGPAEGGGD